MGVGVSFASNAVFNFVIGLLVARFLGPQEFGRFALASATAVVINTGAVDWIRLAAVRFYSERARAGTPEVRATLDASFVALAFVVSFVVAAMIFAGLDFAMSPTLLAVAASTGVASGVFDYHAALARSRFLDGDYARIIITKNVMSLALTAGGAWWFGSAEIALLGITLSATLCIVPALRSLRDPGAGLLRARRTLALSYFRYGAPLIGASILYQLIPLANRYLVTRGYGFGETGQFSLANDIGIRVLAVIASTLDVLLFQLAVRADEAHGPDHARLQVADNARAILAVVLPAAAGIWAVTPSFEALIVPDAYRGPFAAYLTLMLPGLLSFVVLQFVISPMFQIAKRTAPLVLAAVIACVSDVGLIALSPKGGGPLGLAVAQSGALFIGLVCATIFAVSTNPVWPRLRDIAATVGATLAMTLALAPLRAHPPGLMTLLAQLVVGLLVYSGFALILDIARIRERLTAWRHAGA
jgi:O-antigen/teichoic acid export membrane protein